MGGHPEILSRFLTERVLMERKESNQMFVVSNINGEKKCVHVTHCLCLPLKKTKDTQASSQLSSFKANN